MRPPETTSKYIFLILIYFALGWPSCSPYCGIPNTRAPHHAEPKSFSKAVLGKMYRWPSCPQESTSAAFPSFHSATQKCASGCDPIFKPSTRWSEETRTYCTVQLYLVHQFYPHVHQVTKGSEKSHSKETQWTQHSQNLIDYETFCFLTLTDIQIFEFGKHWILATCYAKRPEISRLNPISLKV